MSGAADGGGDGAGAATPQPIDGAGGRQAVDGSRATSADGGAPDATRGVVGSALNARAAEKASGAGSSSGRLHDPGVGGDSGDAADGPRGPNGVDGPSGEGTEGSRGFLHDLWVRGHQGDGAGDSAGSKGPKDPPKEPPEPGIKPETPVRDYLSKGGGERHHDTRDWGAERRQQTRAEFHAWHRSATERALGALNAKAVEARRLASPGVDGALARRAARLRNPAGR